MDFILGAISFLVKFAGIYFLIFAIPLIILSIMVFFGSRIQIKEMKVKAAIDAEKAAQSKITEDAIAEYLKKKEDLKKQAVIAAQTAKSFKTPKERESDFMPPELRKHLGLS